MSDHVMLSFWCFILLQHCNAKENRGKHLVVLILSLDWAAVWENPHLTTQ